MTTKYTEDHEYIRVEGTAGTVGITNYAQDQLGDIVFVELPEAGRDVTEGESIAVVESVKAASEVYAPVTGEVVAINGELSGDPSLVNRAAETEGWFMKLKLKNLGELSDLMDKAAYEKFVAEH